MGATNSLIKRFRYKIALIFVLRYELFFLTILGFLLGISILVIRVIFMVPQRGLLWILSSLLPVTIWTVIRALKKIPSQRTLSALFDEKNRCGGLLMASEEINLGKWEHKLGHLDNLILKWHYGRSLSLFTVGVLFVVISLLIPQRYINITSARPLNISEDIQTLQEQIDTLEEEKIISEEEAQEFEEKLEQLCDSSSGRDPVKTWEGLDHLKENIKKPAEKYTDSSLSQTENLTLAETLAQGLSEDAGGLDAGLLSQAMAELSAMVQGLAAENELFKNNIDSDLLNSVETGNLSEEQLEALLEALRANKLQIAETMEQLAMVKLIDTEALKLCEGLGACNCEGLIAFLNENAEGMGMCNALNAFCQKPGSGGINRGRGDADMSWMNPSGEEGTKFKEQILPPGSLAALKESIITGVSIGAPTINENQPTSGESVLDSATVQSSEAFKYKILPQHKGAVERYFERQ